jgi:hypothetical protein
MSHWQETKEWESAAPDKWARLKKWLEGLGPQFYLCTQVCEPDGTLRAFARKHERRSMQIAA